MKLDDVKKLHQKKYRAQLGYYLVEGEHLVLELQKAERQKANGYKEVMREGAPKSVKLFVTEEYEAWANQLNANFSIFTVNKKQMAQMSDTKTPQGIIACVPLPNLRSEYDINSQIIEPQKTGVENGRNEIERCIYLHEVQDPGNLGTILRTLAWFGHFRLLLSPNSVDPFNPKVVRSSMGAIFHVPIELDVALSDLQTRFKKFAYLDMQGNKVNAKEFANYDCYLFGNEARGVPSDALSAFDADAFTIPGSGSIDSLNLASAVNICVYQLSMEV
jgi:TrmH family RNA methyltransferase